MSSDDIPSPQPSNAYFPDEIVLYGVKLNEGRNNASLPLGSGNRSVVVEVQDEEGKTISGDNLAIAVIYSYSFEGACYRFDRPKLMIFKGRAKLASGCGYDGTEYSMWRIESKQQIMELGSRVDLAEVLVLKANLPGNRTPNTYGNDMQLAHRGNRLTKGG